MTYAGHVCLRFLISKTETRTATTNVAGHLVFVERLKQAQYRDDNDDNINKMRVNKCQYLQGSGALLMRAIRGLPSLILTRNLYCRYHYYPHPTDEKTEAQGSGNFLNITRLVS